MSHFAKTGDVYGKSLANFPFIESFGISTDSQSMESNAGEGTANVEIKGYFRSSHNWNSIL